MPYLFRFKGRVMLLTAFTLLVGMSGPPRAARATDLGTAPSHATRSAASDTKPPLDRSGRKRVGNASFYATKFAGRIMADGTRMHPQGDNAASKTLPLGTTAMVTNLETGRTAIVTIRDRGPYVKGRIVDLSPSTARKIGIEPKKGVAKVEVAPIEVPQPDGSVKPGVSAHLPFAAYTSRPSR
jgi:rare lipoprotein A